VARGTAPEWDLPDPLCERLWAAGVWARAAPSISALGVSTVVVWVAVAMVSLVSVCQVQFATSGALSWAGVVISDKAAARWGGLFGSQVFWVLGGDNT